MRHVKFIHISVIGVMLQAADAYATQPICPDFSSEIEPDMQRKETDFTQDNYKFSQQMLEVTLPEWMESAFQQNKKFPETYENLFQGDVWLAHMNHSATVKGYVLKLEYLAAQPEQKEVARKRFCKFLVETSYFD
jgi:hypothetical protein